MEQPKYDVFISYSRKDIKIADKIAQAFDEAGITYFIDRQGIGGGMEFPAVLAKAIRESKVFLFLASKNSYGSKFTQSEIVYAFNKKQKQDILPYIIDGSALPDELEFTFSAINWRRIEEHPINTVLIDDVLFKIGKNRPEHDGGSSSTTARIISLWENARYKIRQPHFFTLITFSRVVVCFSILLFLCMVLCSDNFIQNNSTFIMFLCLISMLAVSIFMILGLLHPAIIGLSNRKKVLKFYLSSLLFIFAGLLIVLGSISTQQESSLIEDQKIDSQATSFKKIEPIDLGLTSGTMWADRNVGAETASDFGNLYSWGEIDIKDDYSPLAYVEQLKPLQKISQAKHDVATAVLGGEWSLPTEEQFKELLSECKWHWKMVNGHNGYEIEGKNGNCIFLPASGWNRGTEIEYQNQYGYYWTSERSSNTRFARSLQFPKEGKGIVGNGDLHVGRSVRAVFVCEAVAE